MIYSKLKCSELIVYGKFEFLSIQTSYMKHSQLFLFSLNDENKADGRSESDAVLSVCMFVHSFPGMHLRMRTSYFAFMSCSMFSNRLDEPSRKGTE